MIRKKMEMSITVGGSISEEKAFYDAMYSTLFPTDDRKLTSEYKKFKINTNQDLIDTRQMFKESIDFDKKWSDCPYDTLEEKIDAKEFPIEAADEDETEEFIPIGTADEEETEDDDLVRMEVDKNK